MLGVERPGSRDNIFDLGGNSLRLAEIHALLQQRFDGQLQLVHLFENPTIEGLARMVDGLADTGSATDRTQDRAERQKQAMQRRRAPRRAE